MKRDFTNRDRQRRTHEKLRGDGLKRVEVKVPVHREAELRRIAERMRQEAAHAETV